MDKIENYALQAAELLFAADLMPGCDDVLVLDTGERCYCYRFAGHENYGLDHCSNNRTLW